MDKDKADENFFRVECASALWRTTPIAALPPEQACAPRRGIEIITLPGAQAPLAVGRTRRIEKPPG